MSSKNIKAKNGFTIIEVVLVLAIAGLIFLMVFIALPQLQRAQRDTQRRSDLARVATAITQYQTNNGGKLPGETEYDQAGAISKNTGADLIAKYLGGDEFVDPDGSDYVIVISNGKNCGTKDQSGNNVVCGAENDYSDNHGISIYTNAKCDGETVVASSNSREYAVIYNLEGSGAYCIDNQ